MCSGSKTTPCPHNLTMENNIQDKQQIYSSENSLLLEFSASDDIKAFKKAVEDEGYPINESSLWYGRRIGSKKMGLEERTPLMIAAMYGSTEVLRYILEHANIDTHIDTNVACGSDGATALHCAAAGGSDLAFEVAKLLLGASSDVNSLDTNGNKPINLIPRNLKKSSLAKRRALESLLRGSDFVEESEFFALAVEEKKEKKEYPVDVSLPDINTGIYGSDDFRMYSFKVKPCSRAYSHDWTECPFVHPGENARRRDPRKYHYTCVPCPDFRKGVCVKSDNCEYAHGVFESWLHPAQYKTRLCKDEIGCSRKVCFFAHKTDELRPLYASTGSALPSPKSCDISLSSPPMSPKMSPSVTSPLWQNKINLNLTPPALQLPGSRLKTALNARDLDLELELIGLKNLHNQQQQRQQLIDELSGLSSPSYWNNNNNNSNEIKPTNLEEVFCMSPMRSSYNNNNSSINNNNINNNISLNYGFDTNARSSAFAKRSQSFIDRGAMTHHRPVSLGLTAAANSASLMASSRSDWSSPSGKLDWGFQENELIMNNNNINNNNNNKFTKSASFGFRTGNNSGAVVGPKFDEPDLSWVHSLVKDEKVPPRGSVVY